MAALDWTLTRADDVTLVELVVRSGTDERVEIESNLRPVWPPRRHGRPAPGWTDTGVTGVVTADEPLVLGYASPADPVDPPAELTDQQPVTGERQTGTGQTGSESMSPRELVRTLGEAQPPRDAVPVPDPAHDQSTGAQSTAKPGQTTQRPAPTQTTEQQTREVQAGERQSSDEQRTEPPEAWLDGVERRLDEAERLSAVESVEKGHEAVVAAGGIDEVQALQDRLAADRRRVEAVQERCAELDARLADIEIPLATLERVA
jgi:hypothetical protein